MKHYVYYQKHIRPIT